MKITFLIQDLCRQGAQYATALMVRGFVAAGWDVDLIVSQWHKKLLDKGVVPFEVPGSTNVIYLPSERARNNIWALRKYLWRTESVAVVAMSSNYTRALRIAALFMGRRPKIVHVEHGLAGMSYGRMLDVPSPCSWKGLKCRLLYGGFDYVLTVSTKGKSDFLRYFPFYPAGRVSVVYNPVIDRVFFDKCQKDPCHEWLRNKCCPTFVSAGAYQEYKGHFDLLEAIRAIKGKRRFRIIVYGTGPLKAQYEKYIEDNGLNDLIDFAGYTNNFPAEARASDGFVLPSRRESFGIALVEALACGCPVVAADAPYGPREILKDGEYGRLVEVRNPQSLSEGLLDLIDGRIQRPPKCAWNRFSMEAAVERYMRGMEIE